MSEEAKWYVVHTYSGYENKVKEDLEKTVENRNLQDMILEVKYPTEEVVEIKDAKRKVIQRKVYPGYVMIKMIVTDDSWYVVRNTRGCTGFVGPASKPVPLTDKEVEALGVEKRDVAEEVQTADIVEVKYAVGDSVNIIAGPLSGFTGIVDEIDVNNNNVRVTISMFGRETAVELELNQVELIED